jgi:hypothetical protein
MRTRVDKNTELIRIGDTRVILMDMGVNRGKVHIHNDELKYNFSYYWGSMGQPLVSFLCSISADYFYRNISPYKEGDINIAKSMKAVRRWWKEESDIKWYEYVVFQKVLRGELNLVQHNSYSKDSFVAQMGTLKETLPLYEVDAGYDRRRVEQAVKNLCSEPWHYIVCDDHPANVWLTKLHADLKVELLKEGNENNER